MKNKLHRPKWKVYIRNWHEWLGFSWLRTPLLWKDKYNTPRTEFIPTIYIRLGFWELVFQQGNDEEWEWYIWLHQYHQGNLHSALSHWPWREVEINNL